VQPNKRLKLAARVDLRNESFVSAPQLKRDPLGRHQLEAHLMSRVALGVLCGVAFGAVAVATMLPLSFPDKRAALTAAFLDRFAIGFVISVAGLAWPGWATGLFFGLLLSAPSAVITKAWAPILGLGAVGGVIIGLVVAHFAPGALAA